MTLCPVTGGLWSIGKCYSGIGLPYCAQDSNTEASFHPVYPAQGVQDVVVGSGGAIVVRGMATRIHPPLHLLLFDANV